MKNKYIVYLHSCWLSQKELSEIFDDTSISQETFYRELSNKTLTKYVKNTTRRENILNNYTALNVDHIDSVIKKLEVNIITLLDSEYPENLKNIAHVPFILYVRWELPRSDMFGVVGARKISSYGQAVISQIVPEISNIFPIVSGGAAGCDTYAHKSALSSWNTTIAVIGTGIDQNYPVHNDKLFDEITHSGAVISIFRIWEPGNPYNFPVRNEIVVWLSRGILVVEAQEKSGSLITAGLALDMGKDLFAIPGNITALSSSWTNTLIKKWEAKCVTQSIDILEEYDILIKQSGHTKQLPSLSDSEMQVYNLLTRESLDTESLVQKLWLSIQDLTMKLSMLELKSIIKKDMSWKYILR